MGGYLYLKSLDSWIAAVFFGMLRLFICVCICLGAAGQTDMARAALAGLSVHLVPACSFDCARMSVL